MEGNPYARMLGLFQSEDSGGTCRLRLGRVVRAKPLGVRTAGIELPPEALRVNWALTEGAAWSLHLTESEGGGEVRAAQREPALAPGDRVLLLTEDDQRFYLICKVVNGG